MTALILGLTDRIDVQFANTLDGNDTLRVQNPLGKIPCLVLPDGAVLQDSRVIATYLCSLDPHQKLLPGDPLDLAVEMSRTVLADGISDAALLMVYEGRFRTDQQRSDAWVDHQRGKIERTLDGFANDLPPVEPLRLSSLGLVSALGYLDWRKPIEWRNRWLRIVDWLTRFENANPELAATTPE